MKSGPEVIKLFPCSTQLSMKFQMLISVKISRNSAFFSGSDKPIMLVFLIIIVKNANNSFCLHFNCCEKEKFHAQLIEHEKRLITSGPG